MDKKCTELCGVPIPVFWQQTGKSLTEAKGRTVEAMVNALDVGFNPAIFLIDGHLLFIFRNKWGWNYAISYPDGRIMHAETCQDYVVALREGRDRIKSVD